MLQISWINFFHLYNVSYAHGYNKKIRKPSFTSYNNLQNILTNFFYGIYIIQFLTTLHNILLRFISEDLQFTILATSHNIYTFLLLASIMSPQYMAPYMILFAFFHNIYTTYCSCFFYTIFTQYHSQLLLRDFNSWFWIWFLTIVFSYDGDLLHFMSFWTRINFLFSNKACWGNLSCLKYQVVSSLLFHILPLVSEESVYRAITVKAPQIYVFQSPDRCLFTIPTPIWSKVGITFIIYHFLNTYCFAIFYHFMTYLL